MSSNVYAPPNARVDIQTKPCEECGELINRKAEICPKCGVRQKRAVSKTALLLITFFLGGLGAHKFYLRKPWWGLLYLLFFWTYIPSLVALIEFIIYACTSSERLNEKYEGGSASAAVIAIVGVFVLIAVVGILAAIALPAYHDYTLRAKAMSAMQAAEPLREEVGDFIVKNGRLPVAGELAVEPQTVSGLAAIDVLEGGVVSIRFLPTAGALAEKTLEYRPLIANNQLSWDCRGGSLAPKYRPTACR